MEYNIFCNLCALVLHFIMIPPEKKFRKLVYQITEGDGDTKKVFLVGFETDRSQDWTEKQYLRNRQNTYMVFIQEEYEV